MASIKQHPRHNTLYNFYKGRDTMIIDNLACYTRSKVKSTALTGGRPNNARDGATSPLYTESRPPQPSLFTQQPPNKQ